MRTTLNIFAAALLLCFVAIFPLQAQNSPLEGGVPGSQVLIEDSTNSAGKYLQELEKQKLQLDKEMAADRVNAEKEIASSKYDNQRLIVHDIAWNSWVIFVIAIFFFGYLKDKRRHETIRLLIEKGAPITPELLNGLKKNRTRLSVRTNYDRHGYLCWGITLTLVGIALLVGFHGGRTAGWIVLAVGVADLILWFIDRQHPNDDQAK